MDISKHAIIRSQQRGIPVSLIDLIMQVGEPMNAPGNAMRYEVSKEVIPQLEARLKEMLQQVEKLKNKAVVVSENGKIITVYHK